MIAPRSAAMRSAGIVAAFLATLLLCAFQGPRHRRFAGSSTFRSVPSHLAAYREWEREGIRGRILYLFDRRAFTGEKGETPSEENYLDLAFRHGMVRRIYHFIPGSAWPEVRQHLSADRRFRFEGEGFVYPMEEGRLIVTTLDHLPHLDEPVLAVVNPASWRGPELAQIGHVIRDHGIETDLALAISPTGFEFPRE